MPLPTKTALEEHPRALVILSFDKNDANEPLAYDYEWFDTAEGPAAYWPVIREWASDDVKDVGDRLHLIAEVLDTKAMTLGDIEVFGDKRRMKAVQARVEQDAGLLIAPDKPKRKPKPKAEPVVKKARKPHAAAAIVKGQDDGEDAKAEQADAPTPKADKGKAKKNADKAALKKRLAEKAGQQAEPKPDAMVEGFVGERPKRQRGKKPAPRVRGGDFDADKAVEMLYGLYQRPDKKAKDIFNAFFKDIGLPEWDWSFIRDASDDQLKRLVAAFDAAGQPA